MHHGDSSLNMGCVSFSLCLLGSMDWWQRVGVLMYPIGSNICTAYMLETYMIQSLGLKETHDIAPIRPPLWPLVMVQGILCGCWPSMTDYLLDTPASSWQHLLLWCYHFYLLVLDLGVPIYVKWTLYNPIINIHVNQITFQIKILLSRYWFLFIYCVEKVLYYAYTCWHLAWPYEMTFS